MNPKVFKSFQTHFGPQSLAIWWLTEKDLHPSSDYIDELDYFFDGLIHKNLRAINTNSLPNLFLIHHQFGKPFYLIHSKQDQAQMFLKQSLSLVKASDSQTLIHPLDVPKTLLKEAKSLIEKAGAKLAPLAYRMSL